MIDKIKRIDHELKVMTQHFNPLTKHLASLNTKKNQLTKMEKKIDNGKRINDKRGEDTQHHYHLTKNKKALSHIEMIISFSLFIVFLMFLFIYVNPIRRPNVSEVLLDTVELGLDSYKIDFVEIPFAINNKSIEECFNINSPINLSDIPFRSIYLTNEKGENIAFRREGENENNFSIETSGNFYYVYSSDKSFDYPAMNLSMSNYPLGTCNYTKPTFSVPRIKIIYHYQELGRLKENYNNDYEGLKQNFTFPANSDFAIIITPTEGDPISMSIAKPQMAAVTARDIPIEVLTEEGENKIVARAIMNIQVW